MADRMIDLEDVLGIIIDSGGSDAHFEPDEPPMVRCKGLIQPVEGATEWSEQDILDTFVNIPGLTLEKLKTPTQIDFAFSQDTYRWRGHSGLSLGKRTFHLRLLQEHAPKVSELGLPKILVDRIRNSFGGLFLITGPTGSGKTTTMASLIRELAESRSLHIVSAEEPVEFIHPRRFEKTGSIITQVQIPTDCESFEDAMRGFLRKDPDVIVIGELRDMATITMALQAAASGHTVMGTLHTRDTSSAIERVLSIFPPSDSFAIRGLFASALQAIFAQNLIKRSSDSDSEKDLYRKSRILAGELLLTNSIVSGNMIKGQGAEHKKHPNPKPGHVHHGPRSRAACTERIYLDGRGAHPLPEQGIIPKYCPK